MTRRELAAIGAAAVAPSAGDANTSGVEVKQTGAYNSDEVIQIRKNGKLFALYNFRPDQGALSKPFFHPVMGPGEEAITQNGEFPGTLLGHYWHRAMFVAHQRVNGTSFWEERANCGRIIHLRFSAMDSGEEGGFVEELAWRDAKGQDVLHEVRSVRFPRAPAGRSMIDITLALRPAAGDVTFAATPYNLLACRVVNSMAPLAIKSQFTERFQSLVDFSPLRQGGSVTNSEGKRDAECLGARARWCGISGPLRNGRKGGVAILDHPANPRHPTAWHNWKNMTITASFTFREPFTLAREGELKLRYRVLVHSGYSKEAGLEDEWKRYAQS